MAKNINGLLVFDGPVYRGNAKKTIFTRGRSANDISLPGKIGGPAQRMMSAFTNGFWKHKDQTKRNYGLLEQLWRRLYTEEMPAFVSNVSCTIDSGISRTETYFDLRMSIAIDRDRMAQAVEKERKGQNFRLEAVYQGSRFNFSLTFNENGLDDVVKAKFAYLLEEMIHGRFWFGAQKSAGLGKCHLILDPESQTLVNEYKGLFRDIQFDEKTNYIFIHLDLTPDNPMLVSWPWGKKDEKGARDHWVDETIDGTRDHQAIMNKVLSGEVTNWSDIEKLPGGQKFKIDHMNKGQLMDLQQLRRNFGKAVENDDTLMNFLRGYRKKAHEEIDREPHLDFREEKGQSVRGKHYDQIFYRSLTWDGDKTAWKICIPGNTIKGAFRTKAQQILRTLHDGRGCKEKTSSHRNEKRCDDQDCPVCALFGQQGTIAKVFCSDAHLNLDSRVLDDAQCSYDQIAINPETGESLDNSKLNFLYTYGAKFPFKCTLVLKDMDMQHPGHLGFLMYLLKELKNGGISFGGKKTLGFGSINGRIERMEFLCPHHSTLENKMKQWGISAAETDQPWQRYELTGDQFWENKTLIRELEQGFGRLMGNVTIPEQPFKTPHGYVSHRQYSQLCGSFIYELEALTPLHVKESGEPSFQGEGVLGYDFFSISPPKNDKKQPMNEREYAIPPSTLKGAIRYIYNIISQSTCPGCTRIDSLCDTCRLFGWVGKSTSTENALMGRLKFSFARPIENLTFEWYGAAFGYQGAEVHFVDGKLIFPHTNNLNTAVSRHGSGETPENIISNITLSRFVSAGSKFQFQVDFTNLENDELNKILWAAELEDGLAHKLGKGKALGFGSCAVRLKEAYIINWQRRFSSLTDLGLDYLKLEGLKASPTTFANYDELKHALTIAK